MPLLSFRPQERAPRRAGRLCRPALLPGPTAPRPALGGVSRSNTAPMQAHAANSGNLLVFARGGDCRRLGRLR
jgi:hypothetical protein